MIAKIVKNEQNYLCMYFIFRDIFFYYTFIMLIFLKIKYLKCVLCFISYFHNAA